MFLKLGLVFPDEHGHDLVVFTERNHKPSSYFELRHQGFWYDRRTGGDDDTVKRRVVGQAFVTIAKRQMLGPDAEFRKQNRGLFEQLILPFNAVHLSTHRTQNRSLVTRPGTYFKDFIVFFHLEQLALESHGVRLRNGLSRADGKSLVLVSVIFKTRIQEQVTWNLFNGVQNVFIGDAFLLEQRRQLVPKALVFTGIFQNIGDFKLTKMAWQI